jgi:hypothetical protein
VLAADTTGYAEITSKTSWPSQYLQYTVLVSSFISVNDASAAIRLWSDNEEVYLMYVYDGKFSAEFDTIQDDVPSPCDDCQADDVKAHPFWRIRLYSVRAYVEAGDGNDWTSLGSVTAHDLDVRAEANITVPNGSAGQLVLDQILVEDCTPPK